MELSEIVSITKKELSNIDGLSEKDDEIEINLSQQDFSRFNYTSLKYSQVYDEKGNLSDRGITHISFKINSKLNECWITSLGVNPLYERQGIGRKMVHAVEEISKKVDIDLIKLEGPYTSALPFWKKIGYYSKIIEDKETFIKLL